MTNLDGEWQDKKATLSNQTAEKEYGLSWAMIVQAIKAGKLQYREGSAFGNPWLRLLRREVEALVKANHGDKHLKHQKTTSELAAVDRKIRQLKRQVAQLESQRVKLMAEVKK